MITGQLSAQEAELLDLVHAAAFTGVSPTPDRLREAAGCTEEELFFALAELRRKGCIIWYSDEGRTALAPLH